MRLIDPFLMELEQESATTRRVLERVPGDKLAWKPHPKSMSLGQLALHIAQTPGVIAGFVSGPTLAMTGSFSQAAATSTEEVMTALDASLAKAKEVLNTLDDQTAQSTWTLTAGGKTLMSMPRIAVVRAIMLNHWYHHRGQLSVYLRELDVPVPSIYGPSADENPFSLTCQCPGRGWGLAQRLPRARPAQHVNCITGQQFVWPLAASHREVLRG